MIPAYAHWCEKHQCAFVFVRFDHTAREPKPIHRCPGCVEEARAKIRALPWYGASGSGAPCGAQVVLPPVFHPDGMWPV